MEQFVKASYTIQHLLHRYDQLKRLKNELAFRFGLWMMIDLVLGFIASEIVRKEASEEKLAEVALHGADQGMEFIETYVAQQM